MKRLFAIFFVVALMLVFTACGSDAANVKSLSDVYALETEEFSEAYDAEYYACTYTVDGKTYRADADMPDGLYEQTEEIGFDAPDRDTIVKEILGPVEIKSVVEITSLAPSEDDVNALTGKTGQELLDEGFEFTNIAVNDDVTSVSATKDYVSYLFDFDGAVKEDDPAWQDKVAKLKVTSTSCSGFDFSILEPGFEMPE